MCLSCGCLQADNDHGDPRHVTHADLVAAAAAANITPKQAVRNMKQALRASKDARATAEQTLHEGPPKA